MSIRVVDASIRAMFRHVYGVDVDTKEWIREVAVAQAGWVGEEEVDEEAAEGKKDAEAKVSKAGVDFESGDDAIAVLVPESNMLLEGREVRHGSYHLW